MLRAHQSFCRGCCCSSKDLLLSLQRTSRVAERSPFLHPCQPELAFQPSCASWRLNKRRRPRDGKRGAEDSRVTQDSQSSVSLPGVLGRCHNSRWGCAQSVSVPAQCSRMTEGHCRRLTHMAHTGYGQTDVLTGRRYLNLEAELHISANVNTPQHMP